MTVSPPRRRILVMLGMHNSGTSLAANMVHELGAVLGPRVLTRASYAPGEQPRYDYWEHALITEAQDELMLALDRHWRSSRSADPVPAEDWDGPAAAPFRARLADLVRRELDEAGPDALWGFKDPRTVRLLPLWRRVFDDLGLDPLYLVCTRAPGAVARSFSRKAQVPPRWAEALWRRHYVESLVETAGAPCLFIDYEDWFRDPEGRIDALIRFLAIPVPAERRAAALALIDPDVAEIKGAPAPLDPVSDDLAALLRQAAEDPAGTVVPPDLLARLDAAAPPVPDPAADGLAADMAGRTADPARRRVALVTAEYPGLGPSGGIGTAFAALAAALRSHGHAVTVFLVAGAPPPEDAARRLAEAGIGLRPVARAAAATATARAVADALAAEVFDVVHVHEWQGLGAFLADLRRPGASLAGATIVCGTHGPSRWAAEANGQPLEGRAAAEIDALERLTVAGADLVVSPSAYLLDWLRRTGWILPGRAVVELNLAPALPAPATPADAAAAVTELVFFGRLEARKGVVLFCEALERLAAAGGPLPAVTFLGGNTPTVEGDAAAWIARRLTAVGITPTFRHDLDSAAALAWLAAPGRLAVVPSLLENSPYTVVELQLAGIPFVATATGGIPELVAPADRDVLVPPEAGALAERLARALRDPPRPVAPAAPPERVHRAWLAWHERTPVNPATPPALAPVPVPAPPPESQTSAEDAVRQAHLAALLESRSWRLTAPLRRAVGAERPHTIEEIYGSVWWDLTAPLRLFGRLMRHP